MNKGLVGILLLITGSVSGQVMTARKSFEDLKTFTKSASADDVITKQRAAEMVQDAFNSFYFMPQGEAMVSNMMEHYYTIYKESPFLDLSNAEIRQLQKKIEAQSKAIQDIMKESEAYLATLKESGELGQWRELSKKKVIEDEKMVKRQKKYRFARKKVLETKDPLRGELRQLITRALQLKKEVDDLDKELALCRQELKQEPEYYGTTPWAH